MDVADYRSFADIQTASMIYYAGIRIVGVWKNTIKFSSLDVG